MPRLPLVASFLLLGVGCNGVITLYGGGDGLIMDFGEEGPLAGQLLSPGSPVVGDLDEGERPEQGAYLELGFNVRGIGFGSEETALTWTDGTDETDVVLNLTTHLRPGRMLNIPRDQGGWRVCAVEDGTCSPDDVFLQVRFEGIEGTASDDWLSGSDSATAVITDMEGNQLGTSGFELSWSFDEEPIGTTPRWTR